MNPKTKWDIATGWLWLVMTILVLSILGLAGLAVWWISQHWRGVLAGLVIVVLFAFTHWATKVRDGPNPRKENRRVVPPYSEPQDPNQR